MKQIIIFAAVLITISSFASPVAAPAEGINGEIRMSFAHDFKGAELMGTETRESFTKLTFKMNEVVMTAWYSNQGALLAVTRNILSNELPLNLMLGLKSNYGAYWITELFEFNGDETNCYYVSLENADQKLTLRSNGDRWEVYTNTVKR